MSMLNHPPAEVSTISDRNKKVHIFSVHNIITIKR